MKAKPFLNWAGGKRQLLPYVKELLPQEIISAQRIENYYEPFLGGGAVFLALAHEFNIKSASLSDLNQNLITTWMQVRDNHDPLLEALDDHKSLYTSADDDVVGEQVREAMYYSIRNIYNHCDPENHLGIASALIFLNKTCFNGLYRVNSKGEFNVSHGKFKNPEIFNEGNIKAVSECLRCVDIKHRNYKDVEVNPNGFYFLDPPYLPVSNTSNFEQFTSDCIGGFDHIRLFEWCKKLDNAGAKFMLCYPDLPVLLERYKEFNIVGVLEKRVINCNKDKRGPVPCIIVRNY